MPSSASRSTAWSRAGIAAAERIFGYAPHEMIGRSISILMPVGQEEDFRVILELGPPG